MVNEYKLVDSVQLGEGLFTSGDCAWLDHFSLKEGCERMTSVPGLSEQITD